MKVRGANKEWSIYWAFLPTPLYYKYVLTSIYTVVFLAFNVYYFFIRRNCFFQCYDNLLRDMRIKDGKPTMLTQRSINKCLEIIVVSLISSCIIMPGGHENFQLWYINFIPMAIFIAGDLLNGYISSSSYHPLFLFKIYQDIFPGALNKTPVNHQIFSLGMMTFLAVFLGDRSLYRKNAKTGYIW